MRRSSSGKVSTLELLALLAGRWRDDVMKAVNKRVAAGDFTIDPTTRKNVADLMARWVNKSATPGDVRYRKSDND